MSGKYGYSAIKGELNEKILVFEQIQRVNELFSSFNSSPAVLNEWAERISTVELRHKAKGIALAVLTLEKLTMRHLEKVGFFDSKAIMNQRELAFGRLKIEGVNVCNKPIRKFMSEDFSEQFTGLELINLYYASLLDTIFGLPEFADSVKTSIGSDVNPETETDVVEEVD